MYYGHCKVCDGALEYDRERYDVCCVCNDTLKRLKRQAERSEELMGQKILYIMRGVSGSGKSTLARELGQGGVVYSTDDFFMENGEYKFNPGKLGINHKQNQDRAREAMEQGISPVVIDNTHTQAWEAKPYVKAGVEHGYEIRFATPGTEWAFDAERCASMNTHGVPKVAIERMLERWEDELTVEGCLDALPPMR